MISRCSFGRGTCLGTKVLNVVTKFPDPTHDGCVRDTCQTGNVAKPDTFEVKTNTVYPCFNRRAAQRALRVVTTAILTLIGLHALYLAVFDAEGTPTLWT